MHVVEDRLPFLLLTRKQVCRRNLACAFKPCIITACISAVLLETVPQRCLVMALHVIKRNEVRLRVGA
jgi:hypothetical protein